MRQGIYIDISVFGGYFDPEFSNHTIPLFEMIKDHKLILLFSSVTEEELSGAPENVKNLVKELKYDWTEFIETN